MAQHFNQTIRRNMKHIISFAIFLIAALTAAAQQDSITTAGAAVASPEAEEALETGIEAGHLAEQADSAYAADNFSLAEQLYRESITSEGTSSTICYNLGNAYYRQGNLGMAIVNYERALKLDPTNKDARINLEFVKGKITDRQIDSGSFVSNLWENIVMFFKADTWASLAIILFALFLASALTYLFSSVVLVKKLSFFGGLIIFIVCALAVIISFAAANRVETDRYAIILPPSAQLSTTPREARNQSEEAFLLHEGTKVEIVDSISSSADGKWFEVRVGQNERAWIKAADVERI